MDVLEIDGELTGLYIRGIGLVQRNLVVVLVPTGMGWWLKLWRLQLGRIAIGDLVSRSLGALENMRLVYSSSGDWLI